MDRNELLAQAACVRHPWWRLQCVAGHCSYQLSVFFLFRLLLLTHFEESPVRENFSPQYFGKTKRYMQKTNLGIFFFHAYFLHFMASVRSRSPGPPAVPGVFSLDAVACPVSL